VSRNNNDDMALITVPVPPQRLRWLASEMDASGIPYRIQQDRQTQAYSVETYQMAQPILQRVLATTEQWDVFDRKPENRSRIGDAMGFFISLVALGTIVNQSGMIADMAAGAGINGDVARGAAILAVGVTVTMVWSEVFMHHDKRRGIFRESMIALFVVAGMWFILSGMGMDLSGELARWMP
jgi:hypothetical protein